MTEQELLLDTSEKVQRVFGEDLQTLATQQLNMLKNMVGRRLDKTPGVPIPEAEIEGFKQLVTEELWHPALTALSSKSSASTKTRSETSESSSAPTGDMSDLETAASIQSKVDQAMLEMDRRDGLAR